MKPVRIGCSGWNYDDWRGVVYPEGCPKRLWLERYAEIFDTVEVNNTFYRLPKRETVAGWAERTPEGFTFACKASRYLTHVKRLREIEDGVKLLAERLEPLAEASKLGPVLWQLPPNLERDDELLEAALEALGGGRHCFEFRHSSWFTTPVYELLAAHEVALVGADDPDRDGAFERTAGWRYIRFHRGSRGRRGNYSEAELDRWRRRIAGWRSRTEVYVYFNNDWEAFAPRNARTLASGLS